MHPTCTARSIGHVQVVVNCQRRYTLFEALKGRDLKAAAGLDPSPSISLTLPR